MVWRIPGLGGSSPLTRGKRNGRDGGSRRTGLIPAHAGKTTCSWSPRRTPRAHPRSRGENSTDPKNEAVAPGSSPLTRGKLLEADLAVKLDRLIPAHAGKTRNASSPPHASPAHPRSRGENTRRSHYASLRAGSSPLTRGKRHRLRPASLVQNLIPAHAGKTPSKPVSAWQPTAHPRSRGENMSEILDGGGYVGSSPLTRGKRVRVAARDGVQGLIPAHAGKTVPPPVSPPEPGAHPRSRGENLPIYMAT